DVVDELTEAGTTVVLTTQYLEEADRLADHIVVLSRGRVAARGTPTDLKRIVGGKVVSATVPAHQLAALPFIPDTDRVDDNRVRASVTVDDAPAAIALVADLHDRGIEVTDLDVASPSLDDVFTHLAHSAGAHK
ncbi:putative ABC transporter ATP-binding protein, partial [Rhodococcus wratislaviensis IFP 2016]